MRVIKSLYPPKFSRLFDVSKLAILGWVRRHDELHCRVVPRETDAVVPLHDGGAVAGDAPGDEGHGVDLSAL